MGRYFFFTAAGGRGGDRGLSIWTFMSQLVVQHQPSQRTKDRPLVSWWNLAPFDVIFSGSSKW